MNTIINPSVLTLLENNEKLNDSFLNDSLVPNSESKFSYGFWTWYDPLNPRHLSDTKGNYSINWAKYTYENPVAEHEISKVLSGKLHSGCHFHPVLHPEVIADLKRLLIILLTIGHLVTAKTRRTNNKSFKPYDTKTAVFLLKSCVRFFAWVIRESNLEANHFSRSSDFKLKDIKQSIDTYPYIGINIITSLKTIFSFFVNPIVRNKLSSPPNWSSADIKLIQWKTIQMKYKRRRNEQKNNLEKDKYSIRGESNYLSLQYGMFVMISENARAIVSNFLDSTGEQRNDLSENNMLKKMRDSGECLLQKYPAFKMINSKFLDSIELRISQRRNGEKKSVANNEHVRRVENLPLSCGKYAEIISNAREAAILLILSYTGMRYSELALIKKSTDKHQCLLKRNGFWMLVSEKKKGSQAPDEWPAIDCTLDAVKVLESTSRFNGSDYLVSGKTMNNRPLSEGSLLATIYRFIARIDVENKWCSVSEIIRQQNKKYPKYQWVEGIAPHAHRFRHTIASQLAAAGCGMPLITEQLKHVQGRLLDYNLSDITLGYGGQPEQLAAKVNGSACKQLFNDIEGRKKSLRADVFQSYYGKGKKFAGGGAEEHVMRIESFFTGKALTGKSRDQYILKMSQSGMPLTPSAFGFCTKSNNTVQNADKTPCMGDLGCDPNCHHNVIPEEAAPKFINRLKQTLRMLRSQSQEPYRKNWLAVLEQNKRYLKKLDIDACKIEHDYSIELDNGTNSYE